ncbi:hypothetical protein HDU78_010814 [Chytriomyces hyalinus]|nr:hypothetical protein HDU78_010814 [Chytriomyces hyalinus]
MDVLDAEELDRIASFNTIPGEQANSGTRPRPALEGMSGVGRQACESDDDDDGLESMLLLFPTKVAAAFSASESLCMLYPLNGEAGSTGGVVQSSNGYNVVVAVCDEEDDELAAAEMSRMEAVLHGQGLLVFVGVDAGVLCETVCAEEGGCASRVFASEGLDSGVIDCVTSEMWAG